MKNKVKFLIILLLIVIIFPIRISAHPGKTDENGCHVCRTNCEDYGLDYGEYHCHNGNSNNSSSGTSKPSSNDSPITDILLLGTSGLSYYFYKKEKKVAKKNATLLNEIERLNNRDIYNEKEIRKLKHEINAYKNRVNHIAQQHIDEWFAQRYKGRLNPYTNRPILSEKDFNEYLEEYKKRHDGETPM